MIYNETLPSKTLTCAQTLGSENSAADQDSVPLVDDFLISHHLRVWRCIDILEEILYVDHSQGLTQILSFSVPLVASLSVKTLLW